MKKITTLREFYNKSLTKFKEGCQLAQIVKKEENSLEDCVAALKQHIGEGAKLKVRNRRGAKQGEGAKLKVRHRTESKQGKGAKLKVRHRTGTKQRRGQT